MTASDSVGRIRAREVVPQQTVRVNAHPLGIVVIGSGVGGVVSALDQPDNAEVLGLAKDGCVEGPWLEILCAEWRVRDEAETREHQEVKRDEGLRRTPLKAQ